MIGIFVHGSRPYGKVERLADTCVLTTFRHIWWMPIIPNGSYVLGTASGERKMVPIGWHGGSILAAYLRTWGAFWLVICGVSAMDGSRDFVLPRVPIWLDAAILVALVAAGWLVVGRLSPAEAARRRIYGKFAGVPVDVSLFSRAQAADLRDCLDATLAREGRALVSTYRDFVDPVQSWQELAVHPWVTNPDYLEAALTRARLEHRWVPRSKRRALRNVHQAIWARLRGLPDFPHTGSSAPSPSR